MANHPNCRRAQPAQRQQSAPRPEAAGQQAPSPPPEPTVRRWSRGTPEPQNREEPFLRYVHSALAYQNQTLADIKALLEQLALNRRE